ncbi:MULTISPECIES: SDR family NAD(P)-dependent oxidoreductase [Hymenobacter]|uniref:NAD(P)-dependent dehydrogenase, short-chain alcohol dehydrogenase family n=1 Tax=Hymenobacter mucosus TaxID=1411120 RepID=A0A238XMU4_9BACT|nr:MULTISPECIES: SDR family oxidoreductase [Hymenobacter]SNR60030.1 NAD(P)-dependent dehydrogenase, short-chain alcohol dehydrogenase family [Hymenobacter mucosus]
MEKQLAGKVALVTGAASGIGKAIAELYAQQGASVLVSDVDAEKGQQLVAEITQAGGQAQFQRTDVSDPTQCEALVQKAVSAFGQLDIACNNAGIGGELNPVGKYSLEGWKKVIDVNLNSVFFCLKYELAVMQAGGSIINMASILGQVGTPNSAAYAAAKHAVVGLTQSAALEYATQGIRINAVGPGYIETPLLKDLPVTQKQQLVALHPLGRLGRAEEIAELVLWLSSDKASFVTGSYYPIDGGYLAR